MNDKKELLAILANVQTDVKNALYQLDNIRGEIIPKLPPEAKLLFLRSYANLINTRSYISQLREIFK